MPEFELKATVEGEQITVAFDSKEAALATKHALTDAGHTAGVYVEATH